MSGISRSVQKIIKSIEGLEEESGIVTITFEDGSSILQEHEQDCCEWVRVTQVDGDISRHIGATFMGIEEKVVSMHDDDYDGPDLGEDDSWTATFYTMRTSKGYLDWRWTGESNGYYSESVTCHFKGLDKDYKPFEDPIEINSGLKSIDVFGDLI